LQADVLQNVKTSFALRLFGCMQPTSRLSSQVPTPDLVERFQEMYRGFLHASSSKSSQNKSLPSLIKRLVRRVHGALINLFYLSADQGREKNGARTQLTPDLMRVLRNEVEVLSKVPSGFVVVLLMFARIALCAFGGAFLLFLRPRNWAGWATQFPLRRGSRLRNYRQPFSLLALSQGRRWTA
jgi:hypothetical protein